MPQVSSAHERDDIGSGELDVGQLWRAVRKRAIWIILPTLAAFAVSSLVVNMITPRYTSDARVLVQPGDSYYTRPSGANDQNQVQIDEREVASQVQLVQSRDLAKRVIARLGLNGNPEFDDNAGFGGAARGVLAFLGIVRESEADRIVDRFLERVAAFPAGQSRVMQIEFTSRDPQLAQRGANMIADVFLELQEEAKKDAARTAGTWLLSTIEPLRAKVTQAEAEVESFRARTGILVGTNNTTIQQQQLADLNTQLGTARSAQAESSAKAKLLKEVLAGGKPLEVSEVANNDLVRKLMGERTTLRAQIALESRSLLPGHPRIKELYAQLVDIESQIRAAAEKAVRTLENDSKLAGARVESLLAALEGIKAQSASASEQEVQLRALERDAKTQREQLEAMMTRYREAIARDTKNGVPPDARIVSRADASSSPSFPKKLPIIAISTVAMLLIALAVVISAELMSGRAYVQVAPVEAPAMVETPRLTPVAAASQPWVPPSQPSQPDVAGARAAASAAAAPDLSALVRALRGEMPSGRGLRCIVTATTGNSPAGTALALARQFADQCRTVLVDAASAAHVQLRPGVGELMAGQASFLTIIHRDPRSRAHLVGAGGLDAEALAVDPAPLDLVFGALDQAYEVVIVACPSVESSTLAETMALASDHVVLSEPRPDIDTVAALRDALVESGTPVTVISALALADAVVAA